MKSKGIALLFIFFHFVVYSQMEQYSFKRKLSGISGNWGTIHLPLEIFGKVQPNFADIRVYGITKENDTISAPYIFTENKGQITDSIVKFKRLNESFKDNAHYYTFEVQGSESINQIKLEFNRKNYDWKVQLEGSQDKKEWFTVVKNYRILAISKKSTQFHYTTIEFPPIKYQFLRLKVMSKHDPSLTKATILCHRIKGNKVNQYTLQEVKKKENSKHHQSIVDVILKQTVLVSMLQIKISDSINFYRNFSVKYVTDSLKISKGWRYIYNDLMQGTLTSLRKNKFSFPAKLLRRLKIIVNNEDNEPLNLTPIQVSGYTYELHTRFSKPATYFLVYGNLHANLPRYDIGRFANQILVQLDSVLIGNEVKISYKESVSSSPFTLHRIWLWVVMAIVILLIGWFTLKMINSKT